MGTAAPPVKSPARHTAAKGSSSTTQDRSNHSKSSSANTSPEMESHMTFDEVEMQRSRHFVQALKELKNLRPQLYSAAEYCESSYLYSDQKQIKSSKKSCTSAERLHLTVLDNLKDYSVKALVNAVDHLGTVAYKLNDLLSQQTTEISTTELRAASLAQRMRSCQEHSDREGLKQQSLAKTMHANHKHYVLPDPCAEGELNPSIVRETFDSSAPRPIRTPMHQTEANPLPTLEPQMLPLPTDLSPSPDFASSSGSKSLAWHFASEATPTSTSEGSSTRQRPTSASRRTPPPAAAGAKALETSLSKGSFLASNLYNGDSMPTTMQAGLTTSKYPTSAKLSVQRSGSFTPVKTPPPGRGSPFARSSTMVPQHTTPLSENGSAKDLRPGTTRSKSLLRSLLGRRKSSTTAKPTTST